MISRTIFKETRSTSWPAPEGATVTVEARTDGKAVSIRWQRDDHAPSGVEHVVLTLDEFQGIAEALGHRRAR